MLSSWLERAGSTKVNKGILQRLELSLDLELLTTGTLHCCRFAELDRQTPDTSSPSSCPPRSENPAEMQCVAAGADSEPGTTCLDPGHLLHSRRRSHQLDARHHSSLQHSSPALVQQMHLIYQHQPNLCSSKPASSDHMPGIVLDIWCCCLHDEQRCVLWPACKGVRGPV